MRFQASDIFTNRKYPYRLANTTFCLTVLPVLIFRYPEVASSVQMIQHTPSELMHPSMFHRGYEFLTVTALSLR